MATNTATRTVSLPSARVLISTVYVLNVLGLIAVQLGDIVFTDHDPYASEGPVESIIIIGIMGTAALALGVGLGLLLIRTAERAKVGALLFGALSVLTIIVFWSGAPGIFGAVAAWQAGLTRGGRRLEGAARAAGIVGLFVAMLNVVLIVAGVLITPLG